MDLLNGISPAWGIYLLRCLERHTEKANTPSDIELHNFHLLRSLLFELYIQWHLIKVN